jgi:5-methylcytosine-specific restriction endonuclease McrA
MRYDIESRKQEVLDWVQACEPKAWICRQLQCRPDTLNSFLTKWGVDYKGAQGSRGKDTNYVPSNKQPLSELITKAYVTSHKLKLRLYSEGVKEAKCETCGVVDWLGNSLSMHLHHIDGDRFNNTLNNLQILCPNCHAQTDTYARPLHSRKK